jgi:hypothetical protein
MGIEKIIINKNRFNINLKFYFMLKYFIKASLSEKDINKLLTLYSLNKGLSLKKELIKNFDTLFLEIGGHLLHDAHASRVLPGYDAANKFKLIKIP